MRRLTLLTAALLLGACRSSTGPIVIGVAGPFSQPRGLSMRRAAELAVGEINSRGGVRGRQLQLALLDDSGSEDVAVRVAQRLHDDPAIVAVIGHLTSGPSIAAARVYGATPNPVVMISPSASSPDLSGIGPTIFRVCPSDLAHGPALARFARERFGARRVAMIYLNNEYGRGVRSTFVKEFRRLGGDVIEEDPYVAATASFEPYLARIRQAGGVDALVIAGERPGAELAAREMAALGLHWPVLGGDALTGIEADGALAEGMHISSAYLWDRPGEKNAGFISAYARAYGADHPDHRGAGAYDIIQLLAQAIAAVGPSRSAVRDYLADVGRGRPSYAGVTGTIAFDDRGDVPQKPVVIGVVRGGRLVTETGQ